MKTVEEDLKVLRRAKARLGRMEAAMASLFAEIEKAVPVSRDGVVLVRALRIADEALYNLARITEDIVADLEGEIDG